MSDKKRGKSKASHELVTEEVGSAEKTLRKTDLKGVYIAEKNEGQKLAINAIKEHQITFLYGSPGTGKSHISVGVGLQELVNKRCEKVILTRPYVEAGEHLGYLPGSFNSKIAPFMYPVMEVCKEYLGKDTTMKLIDAGNIQIVPLAYMRGVTFKNSFVVLDEAQNSTPQQMRMILTRMGENSKLVINGDLKQSDLQSKDNGLSDALRRLQGVGGIKFLEIGPEYCVRSGIVSAIEERYNI